MEEWDRRFLELAQFIAQWSKDPSTKVGAVIVGKRRQILSVGYNGIPRGVEDPLHPSHPDLDQNEWDHNSKVFVDRMERPGKYAWFEHAERNAIYNAAEHGIALRGATLYVTIPCCADCARAVIQSGITLVYTNPTTPEQRERWGDSMRVADEMLTEAGVIYEECVTLNEERA